MKEALEIDPDYSDALADLGRICYTQLYPQQDDRMKLVADGTTYLERALALDPENVEARCWLAGIYAVVGLSEKALDFSRQAVEFGPNNPEARRTLADRYWEMGFYEAAVAESNQAILSDSGFFTAYLSKATYLSRIGRLRRSPANRETNGNGRTDESLQRLDIWEYCFLPRRLLHRREGMAAHSGVVS